MNILDRFIGYISPQAGFKRAAARLRQDAIIKSRSYEGASKGRRMKGWMTGNQDAESLIQQNAPALRERSRDLIRNNPIASRLKDVTVTNTVGTGIKGQIKTDNENLKKSLNDAWRKWTESNEIDAEGALNLVGIQHLIMGTAFESGHVFIRKRTRRAKDGLTVPLQLQLLEPDFLDTSRSESNGKNEVRGGIEYDSLGRIVAYYFYKNHPGSSNFTAESSRIPAEEIASIFDKQRPGQQIGVPNLSKSIVTLKEYSEYRDALLMKFKIACAHAGFIYDISPDLVDQVGTAEDSVIEPGTMTVLPAGKDVKFSNPPAVGVSDSDFNKSFLREIASGSNVPYELATGDLSSVNYSSYKAGHIQFEKTLQTFRHKMLIPQGLEKIFKWFLEAYELMNGEISSDVYMQWTSPGRMMIDPAKEGKAEIALVRGGIKKLSQVIRESGEDPEDFFADYQKDMEKLDELGLKLDSDPRNLTQSGQLQSGKESEKEND